VLLTGHYMVHKVNEAIETKVQVINGNGDPDEGATVNYIVYDEADQSFDTGAMAHTANGIYTKTWTPDAIGEWTFYGYSADPKFHKSYTYSVGKGVEVDAALASAWTAGLATILGNLSQARIEYLDELDFDLAAAIAAIPTTMVGTDNAALASAWTAGLATILANFSQARIEYLDELDFDLSAAISAIPTTMIGTDGAALASAWTAGLATILGNFSQARIEYLDQLDFNLQEAIAAIEGGSATAAGKKQIKEFSITAAANAGITTVATIGSQPCVIESVIIHADADQTDDMTTCAVEGGVGQVIEFIGTNDAIEANLDAADKQVGWTGIVRLAVGKIIYIDLQGSGATAVDLTVIITYRACVDGGVLS
ncbi:unnamed protein product, partial [marine sediment metagenome]